MIRKIGIDPKYATMTVGQIATDLFESPEVQTFYMRAMQTSNGLLPCDQPGLYYHIHALGLVFSMDVGCDCHRWNALHNACAAPRL